MTNAKVAGWATVKPPEPSPHVLFLNTSRRHIGIVFFSSVSFIYLSNQVWIEEQRLPEDALHAVLRLQLDLGGFQFLLHKVKKRLHFPPGEGQHRIQVIHHPV